MKTNQFVTFLLGCFCILGISGYALICLKNNVTLLKQDPLEKSTEQLLADNTDFNRSAEFIKTSNTIKKELKQTDCEF